MGQAALTFVATLGMAGALALALVPRLGSFLGQSDDLAPSDATLLTYSVDSFARAAGRQAAMEVAIRRYLSGESKVILVGVLQTLPDEDDASAPGYETRVQPTRRTMERRGVPAEAIEVLTAAENEHGEAEALRRVIEARGWRQVTVLAPDVRSRRTRGAMRQATASTGAEIRVVAVSDPRLPLGDWWRTRRGVARVSEEAVKLGYYWLRGWAAFP